MDAKPSCPRCSGTRVMRFGKVHGHQRWRCQECRRTWNELLGTPLFHLHTPLSEIVRSVRVVLHRGSLRAAEEQTGHNYDTVASWIRRLGAHADAVTAILARDLALSEVEIDEFWSLVGKKGRGAPPGPAAPSPSEEVGERWGCLSQDRASRFVVAWAAGPREETLARRVVATTRCRTKDQAGISYVSDGWTPYAETVKQTYRDRIPSGIRPGWDILQPTPNVRLTQAVKHRKGRRLVKIDVHATIGEEIAQPYAVHVERLNGTLRDRLGYLTRKTHAFAKDAATWDALLSLALFEHNWIRPHNALRRPVIKPLGTRRYERHTPAMALGLTDHLWSWSEFLTWSTRLHSPCSLHRRALPPIVRSVSDATTSTVRTER